MLTTLVIFLRAYVLTSLWRLQPGYQILVKLELLNIKKDLSFLLQQGTEPLKQSEQIL